MQNIYRIYIEKKHGFDVEATNLKANISDLLNVKSVENLRILYRYDVQGISNSQYAEARDTIFSDPPQDNVYEENISIEKGVVRARGDLHPGDLLVTDQLELQGGQRLKIAQAPKEGDTR